MVNATLKVWLHFVFFFSLFQASGFDQSVIWDLVKSVFFYLIIGKNLCESLGICWVPNAPGPGFQRFLFSCYLGGCTRPHFDFFGNNWNCFKTNNRDFCWLDEVCGALGHAYRLHWVQFIHTPVRKQSETGCQISTLWSWSAKNNSLFSCNSSGISLMTSLLLRDYFQMCMQAWSRASVRLWRNLMSCSPVSAPPIYSST